MERRSNIVVMGGSFNPPTIAHLRLIQAAMAALNAEIGYLVPVSYAYLKRKLVRAGCGHLCLPTATRLQMLRAMISEDVRLRVYEGEINAPFAITVETMALLQRRHPDARIWFVAGEDKLELLETLTRKWDFIPRFGAVLFARGGDLEGELRANEALAPYGDCVAIVEPPEGIEGVSSTAVRAHLFDADAVADMLHPAVLPLIRQLREADFPEEIIAFKGPYDFLENGFPSPVLYEGATYPSVEAAYQASKCADPAQRRLFARLGGGKARQRGGQLTPRPGWEREKEEIMRELLRQKFARNPELRDRLLATGSRRLINGGKGKRDTYLGVNTILWEGQNRLGELLMELREQLKGEREL